MKWLKITVALFLVTLVKSGPARSEIDADPEPLTLDKIERNADSELIFTLPDLPPQGTKQLRLVVKNGDNEYNFQSGIQEKLSTSYTFQNDLTQFSGYSLDSEILATTTGGDILGFGTKTSFQYPNFPDYSDSTILKKGGSDYLLRVEGTLGSMTIEGVKCVKNSATEYCLLSSTATEYSLLSSTATDYVPCDDTNVIPVCDVKLSPTSADVSEVDITEIMETMTLSYINTTAATIKPSIKGIITDIPILDVSVNLDGSSTTKLFSKDEVYTVGGTFPGTGTQKIRIVKKTENTDTDEWTTSNVNIVDRALTVTQLGNTIIEGRWNILTDKTTETLETPVYRLRKTKDLKEVPADDTDVDCSHLDTTFCFGYFPNLETGHTYTLIVTKKNDQLQGLNNEYNEMEQVESIPLALAKPGPELEILSRHTTGQRSQQKTDVKICFQHLTPAEGRSFSHYEMLIINEKGQWLKHRIMEEKEAKEEGLCFTPFTIITKDFDLTEGTKVVVSQRGLDGVTVLASGESSLF